MYKKAVLPRLIKCFAACIAVASFSCTTTEPGQAINRTSVPAVDVSIPLTQSEIRELKFTRIRKENDHKDLHIAGQVFTKNNTAGNSTISACNNCVVQLTTPGDTSVHINLITEGDGYFSFEGKNAGYTISLNNAGYNRLEIGPVFFNSEGVTTIKIINAAGTNTDKFVVSREGKRYQWNRVN